MDVITLAWWEAGIIVSATIISISYFVRNYAEEAEKKVKVGMYLAIILRWELFLCAMTLLVNYAFTFHDDQCLDSFMFPGIIWLICFVHINIGGPKDLKAAIKGGG